MWLGGRVSALHAGGPKFGKRHDQWGTSNPEEPLPTRADNTNGLNMYMATACEQYMCIFQNSLQIAESKVNWESMADS